MKRWQRKEKIRRIRVQQNSKKVPYNQQIIDWSENCIENDKYFTHSYDSIRKKAKILAIVFGILSFAFGIILFFYPNPWIMFLSCCTSIIAALFIWQYLSYEDSIPFWEDKLQKDSEFLQSAKSFR